MFKYYIRDARKTESFFKNKKFPPPKLIISSPPYHDIKDYDRTELQIGFGQSYQEYLNDIIDVFNQCYNISDEDATLWLVIDTVRKNGELILLPADIVNGFKETNLWTLKDILIWNKGKNTPWHGRGRFKNSFEYILLFAKNHNYNFYLDRIRQIDQYKKWYKNYPERYSSNGKAPSNIWEFNIPIRGWGNGYQNHLCPFPFQLIERIITLSTNEGDLVFDPFAGSGSVLALANKMGRNAIGFDLSKNYKRAFMAEVVIGAEKYYLRRKKEMEKLKSSIEIFKSENIMLRRKKFIEILRKILEEELHIKNYYLLIERKKKSNNYNLVIILKKKLVKKNLSIMDSKILPLLRNFKSFNEVTFSYLHDFNSSHMKKFLLLSLDNPSEIVGELGFNEIVNSKWGREFIFSNSVLD
jgi:DNA modification methylase